MLLCCLVPAHAAPDPLPGLAAEAMRVATRAIHRTALDGGYAPFCAPDGKAATIVVGPDGTAAVGLIAADAYALLGEEVYRTVALDAARALLRSQRVSGGWAETVSGDGYTRLAYLNSQPQAGRDAGSDLRGAVTVDALRLLLTVADHTGDADIAEAGQFGLRAMLNAQLADGGWPRLIPLPEDDGRFACLGDNVTPGLLRLLLTRPGPGCATAARRAGELLLRTAGGEGGWPATVKPGADAAPEALLPAAEALLALSAMTGETRWREPLEGFREQPAIAELLARPSSSSAERSRTERARLTAARAPGVAEWVGALDGLGHWLDGGQVSVARYTAAMGDLLAYLRDYEPLPDFPGGDAGRPPQHRR